MQDRYAGDVGDFGKFGLLRHLCGETADDKHLTLKPGVSRFFIYPAEFDIKFISNGVENPFIPKISTCACTKVAIDYAANGHWAAFRAHPSSSAAWAKLAPPVSIKLQLEFTELEILSKKRILQGH
jgi:hypothetical protein